MNEQGLEDMLLVRHQEMVHDAVTKIGSEDFAGFGAVGKETDRTPWIDHWPPRTARTRNVSTLLLARTPPPSKKTNHAPVGKAAWDVDDQ